MNGALGRSLGAIAFAGCGLLGAAPGPHADSERVRAGAALYAVHCASCHGANLAGGADAPTLRHVGAASVQWWVGSGRMPAAAPANVQAERDRPQFDDAQVDARGTVVTSASPGGIPIPVYALRSSAAELRRGREVYAANCQQCHGAVGQGNTIGFNYVAPGLQHVPPQQIADAIRIGPGPMPHFGAKQLARDDLDDVVSYVVSLQRSSDDPGGFALANYGPVAEGLAAWIFGLGGLVGVIRAIGTND